MAERACIFGPAGLELGARERAFFDEADPWGFILFARNLEDPEQIRRLTGDLRDAVGRDAPILIDQDGGRVQRLRAPHWREWLPARDQCALFADPAIRAESMRLRSQLIGAELLDLGIDVNCAPVLDVATDVTHSVLANRC